MMHFDEIKNFWIEAGESELDKDGLKPTARDPYLQQLIEESIIKYISGDSVVLDIGCGEGSSTAKFAKNSKYITAIDYSPTMIKQASEKNYMDNISYLVGDVLELSNIENNHYDVSINIRCLINLPDEAMQYEALGNIFKKIKTGGLCIFNEGTIAEFNNLNSYRRINNISLMELVRYNKLFSNEKLEQWFKKNGEIIKVITFGDYIYGSRIVQPMIVGEQNVRHNSEINKAFATIMSNENNDKHPEVSYSSIYVVKKK